MSSMKDVLDRNKKREKLQQSLYYNVRSLVGNQWATFLWIIGARGRGKSYSTMDFVLNQVKKYGQENVKIYYFRISDLSIKTMLANQGAKCIDQKLIRKYNLNLSVHGNSLYHDGKPLISFYALVSAAKTGKGVAEFDPDFLDGINKKRHIYMIIDEFQIAEGVEKRSVGNPVDQFRIFLENLLRDQERLDYPAVRIFGCANAVSECSDFLSQLCGFIPEKMGRFKLKRKHTIVENISNSDAYIEKRKKSYGADVTDYENDSNYSNIIKRDKETLIPKTQKLHKVTNIIKFSKNPETWYTVWDGNIIKKYTKQTYAPHQVIAMRRYLDTEFNPELVMSIIDRYDARAFMYADLISQATFSANLKQIKR